MVILRDNINMECAEGLEDGWEKGRIQEKTIMPVVIRGLGLN